MGLVSEVDAAEIVSALRYIDWPIGLFTLLLAGAGAWTLMSSWLLTRLRARVIVGESLGQYNLVEKIGEGGAGEVYLARHARLERPAAIKLLRRDRQNETFYRQFEREAQAASRLRHPNTVEIYDFGQTFDGVPYYVMEYVPGVDLASLVRESGAMPPARAVHIARQICSALDEAHRENVIHRDIKPANVMLCELAGQRDFVKILDFGLAKDISEPGHETTLLFRVGTPFYTAPERLHAKARVDQRCDIYSLGVLLYFLVCGTTPFEPDVDWIESTLSGHPIPPSQRTQLPASLERIILDSISRDPDGRPASARELLRRLDGLDEIPPWEPEHSEALPAE